MSVLNRQVAQTAAAVCDDHDCPRIERDVVRSQDLKHTRSNRLGSLIARPDQNHTRDRTTTGGQEVAEIQSHVRMILLPVWRPYSRRCTTSSPASRNARTVAIEILMSARRFTPRGSRRGELPRWPAPKRRTAPRECPRVLDPDIPERSRQATFHWRRGRSEAPRECPRVLDPDIPERSRQATFHWRRG